MASHRDQHYLAQSYLRGFADRKRKDAIWQYRKSTDVIRLKGISNVAKRRYLYSTQDQSGRFDHFTEHVLGQVEAQFPTIVKKAMASIRARNLNNQPTGFTDQDRTLLFQYIFLQCLRIPDVMGWFRAYVTEHHPRRTELDDREVHNLMVEALRYTHDDNISNAIQSLRTKGISIECPPAGSRASVFTCDKPVLMHDPDGSAGLARATTVVLFPLSRRVFLRLAGRRPASRDHSHELRVHHDRAIINDFNRSVIQNATEEVYASDPLALRQLLCDMGCNPVIKKPAIPDPRGIDVVS